MKKIESIINNEEYLDFLTSEITDTLIASNIELIKLINSEEYLAAAAVRDTITCFILDISKILHKDLGIRMQTLYQHFHTQNDIVRNSLEENLLYKF